MKTKINFLVVFMLGFSFYFSQNPSDRSDNLDALVYVCFSKDINSEKAAYLKNPELEKFVRTNHISFTYDLGFSDKKIDEMIMSSKAIGNSPESVRKLKRIFKANLPLQNEETVRKTIQILEAFPEIEYVSVMSNAPIEPPLVNRYTVTPDLENLLIIQELMQNMHGPEGFQDKISGSVM